MYFRCGVIWIPAIKVRRWQHESGKEAPMPYTRESIAEFVEDVRGYCAKRDKRFSRIPFLRGKEDAVRAIEILGGKLIFHASETWAQKTSKGAIKASGDEDGVDFEIHLPTGLSDKHDLVSAVHQLGHLYLHLGYLSDNWKPGFQFNDTLITRAEMGAPDGEANFFAHCLLMPEDEYRKVFEEKQGDIGQIAGHFQVTKSAADSRGCHLRLQE
jgi:hypothetical protein